MSTYKWLTLICIACVVTVMAAIVSLNLAVQSAVRKADLLLVMGDPSGARTQLQWVLSVRPDHAPARYVMGRAWLADAEYSAAATCLESITHVSPEYEDSQQKLAGALLLDGQLQRGEAVMRRHLERFGGALAVRRQLASLLIGQFRKQAAINVLDVCLNVDAHIPLPGRIELLRDLLTIQFNPPAVEDCIEVLQASLGRHPDQTIVQLALAHGYLLNGRNSEAITILEQLPGSDPSDVDAWLTRCQLLLLAGKLDEAKARLLSIRTDTLGQPATLLLADDRFHLLESEMFERAGDWHASLNSLRDAADRKRLDRNNLARQARLLQRLGRSEEAAVTYEDVHRRASAELGIWHLLGEIENDVPTVDECLRLATLLDGCDHLREADAWRDVATQLRMTRPSTDIPFQDGAQP